MRDRPGNYPLRNGAGDICVLNASCLLSNTRLPANAASLTKVGMLLMPSFNFLDIMARYNEMRSFVFSRISKSFVSIMSLIAEVTFGKIDERLSNYLIGRSENGKLMTTEDRRRPRHIQRGRKPSAEGIRETGHCSSLKKFHSISNHLINISHFLLPVIESQNIGD